MYFGSINIFIFQDSKEVLNDQNYQNLMKKKRLAASSFEKNLIFYLGVLGLLFVPIFKTITNLPPYLGICYDF